MLGCFFLHVSVLMPVCIVAVMLFFALVVGFLFFIFLICCGQRPPLQACVLSDVLNVASSGLTRVAFAQACDHCTSPLHWPVTVCLCPGGPAQG